MTSWSSSSYQQWGEKLGISAEVLSTALASYEAVFAVSPRIAPLLTLGHLAARTDISYGFLRGVTSRELDVYQHFYIKKRGAAGKGKRRRISVPDSRLRIVQQWINRAILSEIPPSPYSFAYHSGSSIVGCATRHAGARWLVKIDIEDFFPSIREWHVYEVYRSLGYGRLISFELARLCTIESLRSDLWRTNRGDHWAKIKSYQRESVGELPMGAPTSPMLSNLVMRNLDHGLAKLCSNQGFTYSRYADDILISTVNEGVTRSNVSRTAHKCIALIREQGLRPNMAKFKIVPPGARKIVLGLDVTGTLPRIPHEKKARLLQHYYAIEKFTLRAHAAQRGFRSIPALERHLHGLISFAYQVEPKFASYAFSLHSKVGWPPLD